jgi:hypothetical protein
MQTAGIAIDNWKLPIFKRHLEAAGFEYTEKKGLTPTTRLLKVKTPSALKLRPTLEVAELECASHDL